MHERNASIWGGERCASGGNLSSRRRWTGRDAGEFRRFCRRSARAAAVVLMSTWNRCDNIGVKRLSAFLSGDHAVQRRRIPFSVDVESEVCRCVPCFASIPGLDAHVSRSPAFQQTEAVYTLLTRSATAHHLADLRLDEPSRLAALIAISQLRVKAAGHPAALDAERSLSELESAWTALLALDQGGGDSVDGGQVQEGELLTRAREAKAKLEITVCSARGELVSLRAGLAVRAAPPVARRTGYGRSFRLLTLPFVSCKQTIF